MELSLEMSMAVWVAVAELVGWASHGRCWQWRRLCSWLQPKSAGIALKSFLKKLCIIFYVLTVLREAKPRRKSKRKKIHGVSIASCSLQGNITDNHVTILLPMLELFDFEVGFRHLTLSFWQNHSPESFEVGCRHWQVISYLYITLSLSQNHYSESFEVGCRHLILLLLSVCDKIIPLKYIPPTK